MKIYEDLKTITKEVEHLEKESVDRLLRANRLDHALRAVRIAFAGCAVLDRSSLQVKITDALVVTSNPHHPEYWPEYLRPVEEGEDE